MTDPRQLHIVHLALQGCLRGGGRPIEYGLTADTGGHIRFLLDLVDAVRAEDPSVRQTVVTRGFDDPQLGSEYGRDRELLIDGVPLLRIFGATRGYLPKERLHEEWQELGADLERVLAGLEGRLVIHAHYADAGGLAAASGVPFVFTPHSLGRVKANLEESVVGQRLLVPRIGAEEAAIAQARVVLVNSGNEQREQLSLYDAHPQRCEVLSPGVDLATFGAAPSPDVSARVERELSRFLRCPQRPAILVVARPVARKNLAGTVRMFAQGPLREHANLIVIAGCRSRLRECDPAARAEYQAVLEAIDDANLYGSVAVPKAHCSADIPGYYAYAAERRGVFVNIAKHEPFGLTVIEAAAAGLPSVVTNRGGPGEIVGRCGHGIAVDPEDLVAGNAAVRQLIEQPQTWKRLAETGRRRVGSFSWRSHAQGYLRILRPLGAHQRPARRLGAILPPGRTRPTSYEDVRG